MPPELLQVGSLQPISRTTSRTQHETGVDPSIILPIMDPGPQTCSANKTDLIALLDPSPVPDWSDLVSPSGAEMQLPGLSQWGTSRPQPWPYWGRTHIPVLKRPDGEGISAPPFSRQSMGRTSEFSLKGVLGISNHGYPARSPSFSWLCPPQSRSTGLVGRW